MIENLKNELKIYWNKFREKKEDDKSQLKLTGRIHKILHNNERGIAGFIKYHESKSVYFAVKAEDEICSKLKVGSDVEFKILPEKEGQKERVIQLVLI